MYFLLTNDVESFSIPINRCNRDTALEVYKTGLPRLLELYAKHDVPATFYFTGEFVEIVPEAVDLVNDHGHEVGCHGYSHEVNMAFDVLPYEKQVEELSKAKKLIEDIAGPIESFRAPALRINDDTIKALAATGFTSDSSICPQRFDGPFTFGSKKKLKWLIASRKPHYLYNSQILEIPISAFVLPYIGTTMRINPQITKILEKILFFESKHTNKPLVFLFHPNECLDIKGAVVTTRRTKNPVKHLFADKMRQKMKIKNLGSNSINLLERTIQKVKENDFEFLTVKKFTKNYKK